MCIDTRPYLLSAKHLMDENEGDDNMKKPRCVVAQVETVQLIDLQDLLLYTVVKDKNSFVCKLAKKYNTSIEYIDGVMGDIKYIREACSSDGLRKLFSEIDEKEQPELSLLENLEYNAEDDTDNIAKILVNLICFRCVDKVIENSSNIDKFKKFIHEEFVDIDFEVKYEDISLDTLFSYVANDIVKLYEFFKQKFTPVVKKYKDIDSIIDAYYWPNDEFDDVPYFVEIDNEIRGYTKYITSELSDKVLAFCLVKLYASIQSTKKGDLNE